MSPHQLTCPQVNDEVAEGETTTPASLSTRATINLISRLPNEILSQIFLNVKIGTEAKRHEARNFDTQHLASSNDSQITWLTSVNVCRRWYKVAMNTPQLWSTINLANLDGAIEMLKRSKSVPLCIICPIPKQEEISDSFWSVAERATDRVRELDITVHERALHSVVERFLSMAASTMPSLGAVKLGIPYPLVYRIKTPLPWVSFPLLRVLELRRVDISVIVPSLHSLVRLFVDATVLSWLVLSLKNTPNIEEVEVFVIFNDTLGPGLFVPATLSTLKHLCFRAADFEERLIHAFLDIPSSAHVEILSKV